MTIDIAGPDGSKVAFPDGTPHADIVAAMDAQFGGEKKDAPGMIEGLVRSTAEGVPIIGGTLNKLDAATNALLSYANGDVKGTWGERYTEAKKLQDAKSKGFEEAHPILSTAANLTGGVASGGALLKAAPVVGAKVLGLAGETLPAQMVAGAASGAGIGALDSATRGDDVATGGEIGALTGAAGPIIGRVVAKGVDAVRGLRQPAPVPTNTVDIAGVPVRRSVGQTTGDTEAITREQMALRGNDNSREQQVARQFFDAQKGELDDAAGAVARRMSPDGEITAQTPQDAAMLATSHLAENHQAATEAAERTAQTLAHAGETLRLGVGGQAPGEVARASSPTQATSIVAARLAQNHAATTQAAEQAATQLAGEGRALHASVGGQAPGDMLHAANPLEAAGIISHGVGTAAENAQAATTAAYEALRNVPGKFHPASFNTLGNELRAGLNRGTEPVRLSPETTPHAHAAVDDIDEVLSGIRQQRDPETGRVIPKPPMTAAVVDDARKRLNSYYGQALDDAKSSNKWSDVRAMRRVMEGFDSAVEGRLGDGRFIGGDPEAVLGAFGAARGAHANFRRTFTSQGAGDEVGQAIQKIVGRHEGQAMPPEQVRSTLYGKGALPIKIAQRFLNIFGRDSQEAGAIKQGYFAHLTQDGLGNPLHPEKAADNLQEAMRGTLGQSYFNAAERGRINAHADNLRRSVPARESDLDTIVRKAATGEINETDLASKLYNSNGGQSERLVTRLRADAPEQFATVRQGYFAHLTQDAAGNPLAPDRAARNLSEAMESTLGRAYFTDAERTHISSYAQRLRDSIPAKPTDIDNIVSGLATGKTNAADLISRLNTSHGGGQNVRLVERLKADLPPEKFGALKQGQWAWLREHNGGPLDVGSRKVAGRIDEFLNGQGRQMSEAMFSHEEREVIRAYGDLIGSITPPSGTVNYSNTASVLGKMFRGTLDTLFGLGGLHFGPVGAIAGAVVAQKGQAAVQDVVRAAKVAKLLYGTPQGVNAIGDLQRSLTKLTSFAARTTTPALVAH